MDLHHLFGSLSDLWSFSHAQCDAVLQSRHIEVVNAYNPNKRGWERDGVYFGFFWIVGWLAFVSFGIGRAWKGKDANAIVGRVVLPFFLLVGVGLFFEQIQAMAQYSDVCLRLLNGGRAATNEPAPANPWLFLFISVSFAGAWITICVYHFRKATSWYGRLFPTVMCIIGVIFLTSLSVAVITGH